MRFVYDEAKTTQAAAYLLKLAGGQLDYLVLMKLLYLGDRQSLIDVGAPISGDRLVSMDRGPVLSYTLNLIKTDPVLFARPWHRFIQRKGYAVRLKDDPGVGELSRYEMRILDGVFAKYGTMNKWALVDLLHKELPEWHDPSGSSAPIEITELLRAGGKSAEEIEEIARDAEEIWQMQAPEPIRG